MKKINRFLILPAFVLLCCGVAFPQKDKNFDKYKSRTLAEIPLINREATDKILRDSKLEEKHDFISFDLLYSRARVEFTGQQRAVSPNHQELIKLWGKLQDIGKKTTSLYENEFLFMEGDREYWIPVQKKVEEAMLKEIKANDMMTLFVVHVGGRKAAMTKDYEWLFLATAFAK
jgi:hypothetical protein